MMEHTSPMANYPKITVFTPTYNREGLLPRVYESLVIQTFRNFEWLIVNDGSEDNTDVVVGRFIEEGKLNIHYIVQPNAGKQMAINRGVLEAKGEMFFILDSDDWLAPNALERILFHWNNVLHLKNCLQFAGVCANKLYSTGDVIGGKVDYDILDADTFEYRHRRKYKGDKAEAFLTSILREYPFPKFEDEKFCPESLVWNRIANTYKLRYFNEGIYFAEYQEGGLTSRSFTIRARNPRSISLAYSELANNSKIPFARRIKASINYWRFAPYNRHQSFQQKMASIKWRWNAFCIPLGYLLYLYEKRRI